jgi:hypothetical protein
MHPQLESIFNEAESRYLKVDELALLDQYVTSLPERLEAYRVLRDRETDVMQSVADNLVGSFPNEKQEKLERSIKHAMLVLRYAAMGMLLEDETFIQERLEGWLTETVKAYNTYDIERKLYALLDQQLANTVDPKQVALLRPMLNLAQATLLGEASTDQEEPLTASALGW